MKIDVSTLLIDASLPQCVNALRLIVLLLGGFLSSRLVLARTVDGEVLVQLPLTERLAAMMKNLKVVDR
jgi:hypothetical protein